ncbi:hypothetical protein TOPH_01911 [Tolypocladium ophioglossoides CBS 100239]|uniref:Uncharacterized protein n=1 Tax=Tolypocladium ophioglossoides (strain CBS 100239) TaxID=1163406 RepID=A0A0L0NHD1_TOLOC|nr:hypothetical protein TOPH_01911 [Tolypocladium ophioglossoides CBS 100239]
MQQLAQHARSILNRKHAPPAAAVAAHRLLLVRRSPGPDDWELVKPPTMESRRRPGVAIARVSSETRSRDSISMPAVQRREATPRPDLPAWDRSVDVVYHRSRHGEARRNKTTPAADFERSLARFLPDRGGGRARHADAFARLPASVRFRIGQYILGSHGGGDATKPVSLNRRCFTRDCWDASDLTPLGAVLVPLEPCLLACSALYAAVMLTVLCDRVFHVTFSPYVGSRLSPLATTWLNKYGVYMRSIIVEVDYTRLGLGPAAPAAGLGPGLGNLEALLRDFGSAQMERDRDVPLRSLVLLCRRFYGARKEPRKSIESTTSVDSASVHVKASRASSRSLQSQHSTKTSSSADEKASLSSSRSAETPVTSPDTPTSPGGTKDSRQASVDAIDWQVVNAMRKLSGSQTTQGTAVNSCFSSDDQQQQPQPQYCPDAHLRLCNHLARLRDRVDALRMCGFSDQYTHQLVATLFPQARSRPARDHCYRVAPSTVWPSLKGQAAYVDLGQGRIVLDDGQGVGNAHRGLYMLPPPVVGPQGATYLPRASALGGAKTAARTSRSSAVPSEPKSVDGGNNTATADTRKPQQTAVVVAEMKTFQRLRNMYGKGRRGR